MSESNFEKASQDLWYEVDPKTQDSVEDMYIGAINVY